MAGMRPVTTDMKVTAWKTAATHRSSITAEDPQQICSSRLHVPTRHTKEEPSITTRHRVPTEEERDQRATM